MRESDYTAELVRRWRERSPGAWVHKISDTPVSIGSKKPFDVLALDRGTAFALEAKLHKTHRAFSLSNIEDHQLLNLRLAEANGAIASVRVAVRVLLGVTDQRRLGFRKRRFSFDLSFTTSQLLDLRRRGVKSVEVLPFMRQLDEKPHTANDEP